MGTLYYYLYTVYQEPEHKLILKNAIAKTCRETLGLKENAWDYFRQKAEEGRNPNYSLSKIKSTDLPMSQRPLKGVSQTSGRKRTIPWKGNGKDFWKTQAGRAQGLCGDCAQWECDPGRSRDGRLHGICGKTGEETERCAWCLLRKEAEIETDASGNDTAVS